MSEIKPSSPSRRYKLIPPYVTGTGENFDSILIFHEEPGLHPGMIVSTDKNDILRVMAESIYEEDFFENIAVTLCQLLTNDPKVKMNQGARELYYMYSARVQE